MICFSKKLSAIFFEKIDKKCQTLKARNPYFLETSRFKRVSKRAEFPRFWLAKWMKTRFFWLSGFREAAFLIEKPSFL